MSFLSAFNMLLLFVVSALATDYTGAYSSPQYAKKLYPRAYEERAFVAETAPKDQPQQEVPLPYEAQFKYESNEIEPTNDIEPTNHTGLERSSFLGSAANYLAGPGQLVGEIAKELLARSTGSSQVLSLNLTNLVILVVLKALVMAAGFFGAGAWKGGHSYGRSMDDNLNADYSSESDLLLYLSYLLASQDERASGCLQLVACRRPQHALLYASGADLMMQTSKLMPGMEMDLDKFTSLAEKVRVAANWGQADMACHERYKCASQPGP